MKCLPDDKDSGHATRYQGHPKLMKDLKWSLNPKNHHSLRIIIVGSTQTLANQKENTQKHSSKEYFKISGYRLHSLKTQS